MMIYDNLPRFFKEYKTWFMEKSMYIFFLIVGILSLVIIIKVFGKLKLYFRSRKQISENFISNWITKEELEDLLKPANICQEKELRFKA